MLLQPDSEANLPTKDESFSRKRRYFMLNQYPGNVSTFVPAVFSPLFNLLRSTMPHNSHTECKRRRLWPQKWIHRLNVPGLKQSDITLKVENNYVLIQAAKNSEGNDSFKIRRQILLPPHVDKESVKSYMQNDIFVVEAEFKQNTKKVNEKSKNLGQNSENSNQEPTKLDSSVEVESRCESPVKDMRVTAEKRGHTTSETENSNGNKLHDICKRLKKENEKSANTCSEDAKAENSVQDGKTDNTKEQYCENESTKSQNAEQTHLGDSLMSRSETACEMSSKISNIKSEKDSDDLEQYRVTLDVSSFEEKNIQVKFKDGKILVEGHKTYPHQGIMCSEILYRHFDVPNNVDVGRFVCKFSDAGILSITGPILAHGQTYANDDEFLILKQ